ncbi:MAG TPA: VPLPA-CTERM sorting domain-containing protein [Steroidobacteraceae bacterium]|nr:VPLPA-CTERM sorting domain-containing protein [Steroidobacteraceae bacterium]
MNVSVKLAVGAALTLASVGAFAVSLPTTGDGSLVLTLFSENDSTPFSYAFDTGTTFSQNGVAALSAPGTKIVYNLAGLAADLAANPAAVSGGLVFDVTAASTTGSIAKAGSFSLETTFDPSVGLANVASIQSGGISQANGHNNIFLGSFTSNPSFTTNPTDSNYANAIYDNGLETFVFSAAGSTDSALPFYLMVSGKGTTSATTTTQYAGTWSIDLSKDTLTYTVAGGAAPVPLPASVWLMISGLAGVAVLGRRRKGSAMDFTGAAA